LINLKGSAAIAAVARVPRSDEDEAEYDEDGTIIEKPIDDAPEESADETNETNSEE
jgi:DNA gyrase subunit A